MANAIPSRPGLKQGGSDSTELFLGLFGGEVLTAFHANAKMRDLNTVKTLAGGREFKFPLIWKTDAIYHAPGEEILGNSIAHSEVIIVPDAKLISRVFIADIDEIMNHYDLRAPYAAELGIALGSHYDKQVLRSFVLAARSSAQFAGGYGGNSAVFTNSAIDANALYNAILDSKLAMENKEVNVDGTDVYATMKPLQYSMLARSEKFINRDYNGGQGSVAKNALTTVDGVHIVKNTYANQVFGVDDSNNTAIPSHYRADFSKTVATVTTKQAVATAEVQGVSTEQEYQVSRQGTLVVARQMTGTRTLRPEAAAEIKSQ